MESVDFIKNALVVLNGKLPYLEIQYEFRERNSTHIIEIKPLHCFEKDNLYIDFEINLKDKFEELFFNEDLLFVSVDSLNKIEKPILRLGVSEIEIINGKCIKERKTVNIDDEKIDSKVIEQPEVLFFSIGSGPVLTTLEIGEEFLIWTDTIPELRKAKSITEKLERISKRMLDKIKRNENSEIDSEFFYIS